MTITEQIREINKHAIKNIARDGSDGTPSVLSGIYLWVEKIHELELRQYGTRLMVEFHIPEPAVSLLERGGSQRDSIRKPALLSIGPSDIDQANYLCLAKTYGAQDIEPPPPQFLNVGWSWASTPSEDLEGWVEDTVADYISIPNDYHPVAGKAIVRAHPHNDARVDIFMAIGGLSVISLKGNDYDEAVFPFRSENMWSSSNTWPTTGVPISVRAYGHFDKTLTAQAAITCERTPEALTQWQLRTWEQLKVAHQVLVREYEQAVERVAFREGSDLFEIQSRPEAENRRIEREELKKWAIKTMRLEPFDFNAIGRVGDFQAILPNESDFQAPIVRFFEGTFEWQQATYFMYPYFWGRRDAWKLRQQIDHPDSRHAAFLGSGAARFIVPVTPGYEQRVLRYLESDPVQRKANELELIGDASEDGEIPANSEYDELWLEMLINRNEKLALGSGTLTVRNGQTEVSVNADSAHVWRVFERDIGRELYIGGDRYFIESRIDESTFNLDEPYKAVDDPHARYATGSVPYGTPWLVRVPTSLVILRDNVNELA